MKKNILKNSGVQSLLASLVCVILGLLIGYIVLLFINPDGAGEAITDVMKNFLTYSKPETQVKYLGNTLVKTAPLLMCSCPSCLRTRSACSTSARPVSTASAWR